MVGWSYSSTLGCRGKRLDVPELSQERVLVVVAPRRYNTPFFVKVTDLAERQRHSAAGWQQRSEGTVVCTFDGKLGDNNVSRVDVLGVGDSAIRERLCPCFRPLSELVPGV